MTEQLINNLYNNILIGCMIFLSVLTLVAIIRSIKGPRIADRIIAINMIGTITMVLIALLAVYLGEDYLLDVCLIYAMVSFLSVVVLVKVFTGIYRENKFEGRQRQAAEEGREFDVDKELRIAAGEEEEA